MESFAPATLTTVIPLDPTKHVNFVPGMLIGADDLRHEFTYLDARDAWLARDLVGFGTAWGLRVSWEELAEGPRLQVSPGVAVSPCGKLICVAPAQCADLNEWLAAHTADLEEHGAAAGEDLVLYVVVCYRECLTDDVPIPGEPCRSDDDLTAPSRVADDFKLELVFAPPPMHEEAAVMGVASWLRRVALVTGGGAGAGEVELIEALRAAAHREEDGSVRFDDPPASLKIAPADAPTLLRAAFRIWTTELRPLLRGPIPGADCGCGGAGGCGCGCGGDCGCIGYDAGRAEPCADAVMLGRVVVRLVEAPGGGLVISDTQDPEIDDLTRPYLLSLRMIQEWLLTAGLGGGAGTPGPKGDTGDKGDKGDKGDQGLRGEQGPEGPRGPQGERGPQGLQGPAGQDGADGVDAKWPVVAAGQFDVDGAPMFPPRGGLKAVRLTTPGRPEVFAYFLTFTGFTRERDYVITGTPLTGLQQGPHTFELVTPEHVEGIEGLPPTFASRGLVVVVVAARLHSERDTKPEPFGFQTQIIDLGQRT